MLTLQQLQRYKHQLQKYRFVVGVSILILGSYLMATAHQLI